MSDVDNFLLCRVFTIEERQKNMIGKLINYAIKINEELAHNQIF